MLREMRTQAKLLFLKSSVEVSSELLRECMSEHEVVLQSMTDQLTEQVAQVEPDLILIQFDKDVQNVIYASQKLRSEQKMRHIPIFVMSAQNDLDKKIAAYRAGVDDYIVTPVDAQEVLAKIAARVRRSVDKNAKQIKLANMILDLQKMEVEVEGRVQILGKLEMHLLALFMRNPGFVLSRQDILGQVWKNVSVTERTIDAHIVSLRRKIKGFQGHLGTVYGSGYVLRLGSFQGIKVPQIAI